MKRVFLIVADSFGIGAMPDAADFGDAGTDTLAAIRKSPLLQIPCMESLGLLSIDGIGEKAENLRGSYARLAESSKCKDTVTGHWELCGLVSAQPFPLYPDGFPEEILAPFRAATGRGVLCNRPYSGTQVIADYGEAHLATGDLIVYTSGDSVFQIAAHTDIIPEETLYAYCRTARQLLQGRHAVGRVIARPFCGTHPFTRTAGRHDYPLPPPKPTLLDALCEAGLDVLAVGKIGDIFSMQGITAHYPTTGNADGLQTLRRLSAQDFHGLCFVNLVDFDMLYGHRRDVDGYAAAMTQLDSFLSEWLPTLTDDDLVLLTGDHGCDPSFTGTDHTREYVPLLLYNNKLPPRNLGTKDSFTFVDETVRRFLLKEGAVCKSQVCKN